MSGWLNIAKDGVTEDKSSRNIKRQTAKRKEHSSVGWKTERHVANNSKTCAATCTCTCDVCDTVYII